MLDAESILHWDLRAKGHLLYLQPKARTFHQNFSTPLASLVLRFHCGRLFAAARAREWPFWKRLFYGGGAPFIPFIRLFRILRELRLPGRPGDLIRRIWPALFVALLLDAAGEMAGYVLGRGNSMARLSEMEFHRSRYLGKADAAAGAAFRV